MNVMEMVGLSVEKRVNRRYVLMIDFQDRFWVLTLEIFGDSQNVNWDKLGVSIGNFGRVTKIKIGQQCLIQTLTNAPQTGKPSFFWSRLIDSF